MGDPFLVTARAQTLAVLTGRGSEVVTFTPYGGAAVPDVPALFTERTAADADTETGDTAVREGSLTVATNGPMAAARDGDEVTRPDTSVWVVSRQASRTALVTVYVVKLAALVRAGGKQSTRRAP